MRVCETAVVGAIEAGVTVESSGREGLVTRVGVADREDGEVEEKEMESDS